MERVLGHAGSGVLLVEHFGLDIGAFFEFEGSPRAKLVEAKVFVGQRPGGVPLGTGKGSGPQIDLLLHGEKTLRLADTSICWVLGHGLKPADSPRFAIFDSVKAKRAAMGGVSAGKHNNLRVSDFTDDLITWPVLCERLRAFLLS